MRLSLIDMYDSTDQGIVEVAFGNETEARVFFLFCFALLHCLALTPIQQY